MSDIACSRGCFICGNRGDGPATGDNSHDSSCCASTRCNSRAWDKQTAKWLKAETKYKQNVAKWLLAEMLHSNQLEQWLAAEQDYRENCELWLAAQREFRMEIRSRSVRRVRVQAAPATPQTAKVRAHAR